MDGLNNFINELQKANFMMSGILISCLLTIKKLEFYKVKEVVL